MSVMSLWCVLMESSQIIICSTSYSITLWPKHNTLKVHRCWHFFHFSLILFSKIDKHGTNIWEKSCVPRSTDKIHLLSHINWKYVRKLCHFGETRFFLSDIQKPRRHFSNLLEWKSNRQNDEIIWSRTSRVSLISVQTTLRQNIRRSNLRRLFKSQKNRQDHRSRADFRRFENAV